MNGCAVYSVACGVCTYVSIRKQSLWKKALLVSGCPFRFMLVTVPGCNVMVRCHEIYHLIHSSLSL